MKESQIAVMWEFADNVKILINALGYKVLEPFAQIGSASTTTDDEVLSLSAGSASATGQVTTEGFVVFEGAIVNEKISVKSLSVGRQKMRSLERIISAYLDLAKDRAERHIPMTMGGWTKRLDIFLMAVDREVIYDAGKITAEIAKAKAEMEFEKYRVIQERLFVSDFDKYTL